MVNNDWCNSNSNANNFVIAWIVHNFHHYKNNTTRINTKRFTKVFEYASIQDLSGVYKL